MARLSFFGEYDRDMDLNPKQAGFSEERLERITAHMNENYIAPGKISGCQVMVSRGGTTGYFRSFGEMPAWQSRAIPA